MFDDALIRAINKGRCFALIGAGPSCEMGYLSWSKLAEATLKELVLMKSSVDIDMYKKYSEADKYPELFRLIEEELGDKEKLLKIVKDVLSPSSKKQGHIYSYLTNWPFACYLTTNFDNEIKEMLDAIKVYYTVNRNRPEDFHPIRNGVSNLILKLHSDLDHPDEVVLTSKDYSRLYIEAVGEYFRTKLRMIFETYDIIIVGHSLKDPDIEYILQKARTTTSPGHPIYMFAPDATVAEEREYFEKYNIRIISYRNSDGNHSDLKKMLSLIDKFIVKRDSRLGTLFESDIPFDEYEKAIVLFLFRKLQASKECSIISPLILLQLNKRGEAISLNDLISESIFSNLKQQDALTLVVESIEKLKQEGFVKEIGNNFELTQMGQEHIAQISSIREAERDQAFGQFILGLKEEYSLLTEDDKNRAIELTEKMLTKTFQERGLIITNNIYSGRKARPNELSDIFALVSNAASDFKERDLQSAYVSAVHQFIINPTDQQKSYLSSVSQGYFLYHLLGQDPQCAEIREIVNESNLWLLDSNILMPFIAKGCFNHEYAKELFRILGGTQSSVCTTMKLIQEAFDHLRWAITFVHNNGTDTPEFLRGALVGGSYQQNLFIDGYIQSSADGIVGSFADYIDAVLPGNIDIDSLKTMMEAEGIKVIEINNIEGYQESDLEILEEWKSKIQKERERRGIFKSDFQVSAEAEVVLLKEQIVKGNYTIKGKGKSIINKLRFVSQSHLLDFMQEKKELITWTPETVYRYLSTLPEEKITSDLLQQCLLQEYFYAGITFIDKQKYKQYFGANIDASKISFEEQKQKYISEVEESNIEKINILFKNTPDLEKPFFVFQMNSRLLDEGGKREQNLKEKLNNAEKKVKELESERESAWKKRKIKHEEQEAARLRNLKDPKHVKKRIRQAKKRKRKKKKK